MRAAGGGRPGDQEPGLDLDLDLRIGGDAQVSALFREGLRPRGGRLPDLRAIERRARRRHRRVRAAASSAVLAAVVAAVLVVVSPWSAPGAGQGMPAVVTTPSPTGTPAEPPTVPGRVTKSLLLPTHALALTADQTGLSSGARNFRVDVKAARTTVEVIDRFCAGPALPLDHPAQGWVQSWKSTEGHSPADYHVYEEIRQSPGRPDRASALVAEMRAEQGKDGFCALGAGSATDTTAQEVGGDPSAKVPVLVRQITDRKITDPGNRERGQAVAVWGDFVVIIDVLGPAAADRAGAGETVGEIALNLLGVAMDRVAGPTSDGRDRSSPRWSAPRLHTDVPTSTGGNQ